LSGRVTYNAFSTLVAATRSRLLHINRYPGLLLAEIFVPIIHAMMPILLGRAIAGDDAGANFARNTGTANYVAYLLIGSNTFIIINRAFWDIGYWLRFEQETGTLEAIYLTPSSSLILAAGVALYSAARGFIAGLLAYIIGCIGFRVNPFQGEVLLALLFTLVGLVPVYAMALLFSALVLRVKEAHQLLAVVQWGVSFLVGVYFPIHVLPRFFRVLALLFPPTWMIDSVRSAILGTGYFFQTWYLNLAVLWAFMLLVPLLSISVFHRVESGLRRNQGLGGY